MPAIATHHKYLINTTQNKGFDRINNDISTLVTNIASDILLESPGLVADVASGIAHRKILETAIVKDMDKRKYHNGLYREELIRKVFDYMFGYGDLQHYIDDEDITDIDGTAYNEFSIKTKGKRTIIPVNFGNEKSLETYCKLIAIRNGGILNENDSHCRITDEAKRLRINVSIKPRNISGAAISIRKHRMVSYSLKDLYRLKMLNEMQLMLFEQLADSDQTILFCGKGAAGKTTLLRAFINAMPQMERVLIAESDAEIFSDKPYCIEQKIKKVNEGGRAVTLADLVRDGLTMSLDTYCIGEMVGAEGWDFVKAAFTGHRALATIHSESAEDVFDRLLTLCKSQGIGESENTVKKMIGRGIDIVVYLKNFTVQKVLQVDCYDEVSGNFQYQEVGVQKEGG